MTKKLIREAAQFASMLASNVGTSGCLDIEESGISVEARRLFWDELSRYFEDLRARGLPLLTYGKDKGLEFIYAWAEVESRLQDML